MSSTLSTTEVQTIPPRVVARLKMEEKPRLVRASSIEKIRRFNSFICSQQYYILPALISWLKSSQSGLQSSTEKTIFLFRSVLFNTFVYKLYLIGFRSAVPAGLRLQKKVKLAFLTVVWNFYRKFTKCFESTFLLAVGVYGACAVVLLQLVATIYLMYLSFLPYGFIFLVLCMASINYLCYRTMFFFVRKNSRRCCK